MMASNAGVRAGAPTRWYALVGIALSGVLLALYARGGHAWLLGFCALVPWLLVLNSGRTLAGAVISGWLMSVAYVVAVFGWFGSAIGAYTGVGTLTATIALCVLAPLLQLQVLVYAVSRHLVGRRSGPVVRALAGASAWVACEWIWVKLLGDTLGHGLYPSAYLRQLADLGGAAGLSFLLILINEALALALSLAPASTRWRTSPRALLRPLALSATLVVLMFGYGIWRLSSLHSTLSVPAPSLRIGMVQSAIIDYDKLRREVGAYAVVRNMLDIHFALSRAALEQHGVDALLWSETVYPTTFGHPRSADGAVLDQEILDFVTTSGVPLVFGTYDLDEGGEYNAAAFIEPRTGLLGYYRKTHPFPLTEHVPEWLEGPWLRRWLPWTGNWKPGNGARVFPLRASDGRELSVLPLICLDATRPGLSIDGTRLGAQAILGLSNDSWFSADPLGAQLHLAVAAFRSIETRLPQLRVTTNGLSAIIDPTGAVIAGTAMGDRAVLAGDIPMRGPPSTLMVRWGDWVGGAGLAFLLVLSTLRARSHWRELRNQRAAKSGASVAQTDGAYVANVVVMSRRWRAAAALLRLLAGAGLLWLVLGMLLGDGLQVNSLAQIKVYALAVLLPEIAASAIQHAFAANAYIETGMLVLRQRHQRIEIPLVNIARLHPWRLALPRTGVDLEFVSGRRLKQGIVLADPQALMRALSAADAPVRPADRLSARITHYAAVRAAAAKPWLDHPLLKFVLFPLVPALAAFRLHQHIAFGGTFGEYYTYGLGAYLIGLLIWWTAWSIGLILLAALLRIVIESGTLLAMRWRPIHAQAIRRNLEGVGRLIFYFGVPAWLILRVVSA